MATITYNLRQARYLKPIHDSLDALNTEVSGLTALSPSKNKLDATTAPGVTNDVDEGYTIGSMWIDVTADEVYVATDVTDGAAKWFNTSVQATAAAIANVAAGDIVATDVQAAIDELDTEKLALAGGTMTGAIVYDSAQLHPDLGEFAHAGLPSASGNPNAYCLVTDASGGRTIVRSDATNWKVVAVEGATVTT